MKRANHRFCQAVLKRSIIAHRHAGPALVAIGDSETDELDELLRQTSVLMHQADKVCHALEQLRSKLRDRRRRYQKFMAPCGLRLVTEMVEPAMWLEDASNRLLLVWEAPDAGAVWSAKHRARPDESVTRWRSEEAPAFIVSRRRMTMAPAEALEALADV